MMPEVAYKEERRLEIEHVNRGIFDAHMERIDQRADILERQMNERFDRMQSAIKEVKEEFPNVDKRTEAIIERKLAKQGASIEKAIHELGMNIAKISGQLEGTNARLEALEGKTSQAVAMLGIIATVFGVIIAALQFWKG